MPFVDVTDASSINSNSGETNQLRIREFGFRDLEAVHSLRRKHVDQGFAIESDGLRLPQTFFAFPPWRDFNGRSIVIGLAVSSSQGLCELLQVLQMVAVG